MYSSIKNNIVNRVYENTSGAVTAQVLQTLLTSMVDTLGGNSNFMGIADKSTVPTTTPDGKQFYLAISAGTYSSIFGGITLVSGDIYLLFYNDNGWQSVNLAEKIQDSISQCAKQTDLDSLSATVVTATDVDAPLYNVYAKSGVMDSLTSALKKVPETLRKGGMMIVYGNSIPNFFTYIYKLNTVDEDSFCNADNWSLIHSTESK